MSKVLVHWYHHHCTEICDLTGIKEEEGEKLLEYLRDRIDSFCDGVYDIEERE